MQKKRMIYYNFDIKNLNSFNLPCKVKTFLEIDNEYDIQLLENIDFTQRTIILAGGSNSVFTNPIFDGSIIHIKNKGIKIIQQTDDDIIIEASSGEDWGEFVRYCVKQNYSGIENLAAIPGSVGASPVQNVGAYGMEVKDIFHNCLCFNPIKKEWKTYTKEECKFDYRYSIFKYQETPEIIWKVRYKLSKHFKPNLSYSALASEIQRLNLEINSPLQVCDLVTDIRNSKLPNPKELGNAGSFFKNPVISPEHFQKLKEVYPNIPNYPSDKGVKIAAGWLIEQTGYKGKQIGNVGMHSKQALVMVNYGNAQGSEIIALANKIIKSIREKFQIELEIEAHLIY